MKVRKECAGTYPAADSTELSEVNNFAKTELKEDEVYIFSILLCDNEVDRDFEKFSDQTLEELRQLFIGRTGICDHDWRADMQKARIYRTELVRDKSRKNSLGEPYAYLKGYAYMLRCPENQQLIAEIEAGIKKETSVGCSVAKAVCSICGEELGSGGCSHIKGRMYGGRLCFAELQGAVDAYEWSFVAVPAQRQAGVIKAFDITKGLKGFVESEESGALKAEFNALEQDAAIGRKCMNDLRKETARLSLVLDNGMYKTVKSAVEKMSFDELCELRENLEEQLSEKMPVRTQLPGRNETVSFDGGDFII